MHTVIIIPARHGSTRFPGKPLVRIGGKTLIERTWAIAKAVAGVDAVYVATDHPDIHDYVLSFGGKALMTSMECRNGTERVYAALSEIESAPDVVINLQGDAVLTPPWIVQSLVDVMQAEEAPEFATLAVQLNRKQYKELRVLKTQGYTTGTLVTFDKDYSALYFSRSLIPYMRAADSDPLPVYRHIGTYAYSRAFLQKYLELSPTPLEQAEGLEQLRALENGLTCQVVIADCKGRTLWSVDNPGDVQKAEEIIACEGELICRGTSYAVNPCTAR